MRWPFVKKAKYQPGDLAKRSAEGLSRPVGSPDVRVLLKLLAKAGDPAQVSVVYEAGPTGYGLYRELRQRGYRCEIVAPSLIPRRPRRSGQE